MSINAIRIDVDGTVTTHDLDTVDKGKHFSPLGSLVGGYLEGFGTTEPVENLGLWAYCNEEGRLEGLPYNPVAAIVCGHVPPLADGLVGPIVFAAPDIYDEETDEEIANPPLTEEQIEGIRTLAAQALSQIIG